MDIIMEYPPIRVWGTIGFIVALWVVSLSGLETSSGQFYVASIASLLLGLYAFTLPKCPPLGSGHKKSLSETKSKQILVNQATTSGTIVNSSLKPTKFNSASAIGYIKNCQPDDWLGLEYSIPENA